MSEGNALFLGTYEDHPYLSHLKGLFGSTAATWCLDPIELITQLEMYCARKHINKVVTTSTKLLRRLLDIEGATDSNASLDNYSGSLFRTKFLEIVFTYPLKQLSTVSSGKFICKRHISKLTEPESWSSPTKFLWKPCLVPNNLEEAYNDLQNSYAISVDIETTKVNLAIRCINFTGIFWDSLSNPITRGYVIPLDSEINLAWVRKIAALPAQKIFQKGKYDNSYLLRYHIIIENYLWDTANLFHSWYSELPKDLAFLNAFFLRDVIYWKDMANTSDLLEYYKYNAMDGWATANVWIQEILTMPEWAKKNYYLEFPLTFPCLLAEMTGVIRDQEILEKTAKEIDEKEEKLLTSLRKSIGLENFNPASPTQVVKLLKVFGCGDIDSSGEKEIKKAQLRHPLINRVFEGILDIRGYRKLRSNYLRLESDKEKDSDKGAKEFHGTILYTLNPDGTETGRLASREHHFWCGLQFHNIPTRDGPTVKQTFRATDGFFFGECDLEQAESRDTGYISGDEKLIAAVESGRDFHATNASAFFGVPYNLIFSDELKKTIDKKLRDLSKRTNHGATYNMGVYVLIDTMGIDKIWEAGRILKLPRDWDLEDIAEYLLCVFHITYPTLRGAIKLRSEKVRLKLGLPRSENKFFDSGTYYASIVYEIRTTNRITSRAYHHTRFNEQHFRSREWIEEGDWTRHCFGKPETSKPDLNSYVAHPSQSLNSRTLNEAWMEVFYEVALPNPLDYRLHAQIHDSILFSYRSGREDLASQTREIMEIPVTIRDVHGTYRKFLVPAALKLGKKDKDGNLVRAKYWSDTE